MESLQSTRYRLSILRLVRQEPHDGILPPQKTRLSFRHWCTLRREYPREQRRAIDLNVDGTVECEEAGKQGHNRLSVLRCVKVGVMESHAFSAKGVEDSTR